MAAVSGGFILTVGDSQTWVQFIVHTVSVGGQCVPRLSTRGRSRTIEVISRIHTDVCAPKKGKSPLNIVIRHLQIKEALIVRGLAIFRYPAEEHEARFEALQ